MATDTVQMKRDIKDAMNDPKVAALGHRGIYNKLKHKYKKKQLMTEIRNVDSHQIHYKINKKTLRSQMTPIRATNIGFLQIDFAVVPKEWTGNVNAKCKYLLVVVDIYSRFMWVVCLASRASVLYCSALSNLFKLMKTKYNFSPYAIVSDNEFISTEYKTLLSKNNIKYIYSAPGPQHTKTAIVEKNIGTLKLMINRYLTHNKTRQFKHVLDKIVDAYNETKHSSIGVSPKYVMYHKWVFPPRRLRQRPIDNNLKPGDIVRFRKSKDVFSKGHKPNYTRDLYVIVRRVGNRYIIKNTETDRIKLDGKNKPLPIPRHRLLLTNKSKQNVVDDSSSSDSDSGAAPIPRRRNLSIAQRRQRRIAHNKRLQQK